MLHLNEWGLAGRGFGTFITWFLLGGDLYTAYTFIAVPALVFGSGSIGFFAVSYTIMVYPIAFIFLPRLWSVCRVHGYVTPGDFIRGRYGSRGLALAIGLHRHPRADAVHRAAARRHPGGAHRHGGRRQLDQHLRQGPAAVRRVRGARDLHRTSPGCARRPRSRSSRTRSSTCSSSWRCSTSRPGWAAGATSSAPRRRTSPSISPVTKKPLGTFIPTIDVHRQHPVRLRHAGARLRDRAVRVPAHHHRHAGREAAQHDQAEHVATCPPTRSCSA